MDVVSIVLAAGDGKRMNSDTPKILHKIAGRELIDYVLDACNLKENKSRVVVVGVDSDSIKDHLGNRVELAVQAEQKGTGHAVICADEYFGELDGYVIVLAGDMPLIKKESIEKLLNSVKSCYADVGLLTVKVENPAGYGRIIRDENGNILKIVEDRDADEFQKKVDEINISIYCFEAKMLKKSLASLKNNNAQGEYYLTDCIDYIAKKNGKIIGVSIPEEEGLGVNDLCQLENAEKLMRARINKKHMLNGVRIIDSDNTYIDYSVLIGRGTVIYPGNTILGKCEIGANTQLKPGNTIEYSVIGDSCQIGPSAHLRPNTNICDNCKIGNFVELKNLEVGKGSKIPHLSYCGDGTIGEDVNIGCGVIFINYDGVNKYNTVVEDNAFVGCNSNLIAPVTIGENSYIASGSTITKDVPKNALAIGRSRQTNKKDWALTKSPMSKNNS